VGPPPGGRAQLTPVTMASAPGLRILTQPDSSFYKEEGGRANNLCVVVGAPTGAAFPGQVRLSLTLCYGSCTP
jgi:hypothetical protein